MSSPLNTDLRAKLEVAVLQARELAETAAKTALNRLAIGGTEGPRGLSSHDARLRATLRERARQLGGGSLSEGLGPLVEETAYTQWHRMLFARFLAESGFLMHPSGVGVTLAECSDLARDEGAPDAWALAARYAGQMLPGIFREDDPVSQLRFSPEARAALEKLLQNLPEAVFAASDALGWVYQFWQARRKEEVNRADVKIGGRDLPAVTQLFTEDYMVRFLLDNSLGAWWHSRHPRSPLIEDLHYLRLDDSGHAATGSFPGWPEEVHRITVMDPCCGSGHFLVEAFDLLRLMRMEEENLDGRAAGEAVLRDNLFGLELDPRCTQIAAFALVLAAWKADGYRRLPIPNVACSGIPVRGQLADWKKLAREDYALASGMEELHTLFASASDIGSLINPQRMKATIDGMFSTAGYTEMEPLLEKALASERGGADPAAAMFGAVVRGVTRAAELLARTYTLVATNVPYLARGRQNDFLKSFCAAQYPDSKGDLATVFVERCREFAARGGAYALVTPHNWRFLNTYGALRLKLLSEQTWLLGINLGPKAFQTPMWDFNVGLSVISNTPPPADHALLVLDLSGDRAPSEKAGHLRETPLTSMEQAAQLRNPDARISMEPLAEGPLLEQYASGLQGVATADYSRYGRCLWELPALTPGWAFQQSTVEKTTSYDGREHILWWEDGKGQLARTPGAYIRGWAAFGRKGVAVSQIGDLPCTLYTGEVFDNNTAVILPKQPANLPAIWAFCRSPEFTQAVRAVDQALKVTNATLVKVPFDLDHWRRVAEETGPLPEPHSNDPTQWLFDGRPERSTEPLQVAVARLLGYHWPGQKPDDLDELADPDGILPVVALAGEMAGADRLRAILARAYGSDWSRVLQENLLGAAGFAGQTLEGWVRDGFFMPHCRLFDNRPFIWQVWDGRPDGFSALVNYHRLDYDALNRLIYTYLGTWITRQRAEQAEGTPGAEGRVVAALYLQERLKGIRDGEPPYDIYVRWKPLARQPIGWRPDLNDGVRLNVRPFVLAGVLRAKFTVSWAKDRGKEPGGRERENDLHFSTADKTAAHAKAPPRMTAASGGLGVGDR